jgi:YihY family inner membrane protein
MARASWTEQQRVVAIRRRWPVVNTIVAATERFRIHRTGRNSALVAHYAFLSVFPLMLVFTTILGFVLQGNPELQQRIIDSALAQFPFIGGELEANPDHLQGSVGLLIFGLLTALWAGLKAFNVLQMALDDIDDVPIDDRPNLVKVRLQSLVGATVIGAAQVATAVLSGFVSAVGVQWGNRVLLLVGTITVNTLVIAATYRWLGTRRPTVRELAPGAIFAGLSFTVLQLVGTTLMTRAILRASPIYGTFATVIGLLFWLGLHSMVALLGAEMNGVVRLYRKGELSRP